MSFCLKLWNSAAYTHCVAVVSAKWGAECVRLRVVVKSDNCGEGQDCSGKGVCFSNISMVSTLSGRFLIGLLRPKITVHYVKL